MLSPSRFETERLLRTEFLMGYGDVRALLGVGAVAGTIVGLFPLIVVSINALLRYIATLGSPYIPVGDHGLGSLVAFIPDVLLFAVFGAGLSYFRRLSIRKNLFTVIRLQIGRIRVGIDDLFGLVLGAFLLWFIFYRREIGLLYLIAFGTNAWGFLFGWVLTKFWESIYMRLVRKLITVPLETELTVTVKGTLQDHPDRAA